MRGMAHAVSYSAASNPRRASLDRRPSIAIDAEVANASRQEEPVGDPSSPWIAHLPPLLQLLWLLPTAFELSLLWWQHGRGVAEVPDAPVCIAEGIHTYWSGVDRGVGSGCEEQSAGERTHVVHPVFPGGGIDDAQSRQATQSLFALCVYLTLQRLATTAVLLVRNALSLPASMAFNTPGRELRQEVVYTCSRQAAATSLPQSFVAGSAVTPPRDERRRAASPGGAWLQLARMTRWLALSPPTYVFWWAAVLEATSTPAWRDLLLPAALHALHQLATVAVQQGHEHGLLPDALHVRSKRWLNWLQLLHHLQWLDLATRQLIPALLPRLVQLSPPALAALIMPHTGQLVSMPSMGLVAALLQGPTSLLAAVAHFQESLLASALRIHPDHLPLCRRSAWLRGLLHLCVPSVWLERLVATDRVAEGLILPPLTSGAAPMSPSTPTNANGASAGGASRAALSTPTLGAMSASMASLTVAAAAAVGGGGGSSAPLRDGTASAPRTPPRMSRSLSDSENPPAAAAAADARETSRPRLVSAPAMTEPARRHRRTRSDGRTFDLRKIGLGATPSPPDGVSTAGAADAATASLSYSWRRPFFESLGGGPAAAASRGQAAGRAAAPKQPAALVAPLLSALKALEAALPPDLRTLLRPLFDEIEAHLSSSTIVPQIGAFLSVLSAALSHIATAVLLQPRGRRQLQRGLRALSRSSPQPLPSFLQALADHESSGRELFLLGLRGSNMLDSAMQVEENVPRHRLYDAEGTPPQLATDLVEGALVRVQMAETAGQHGAPLQAASAGGLFTATVLRCKTVVKKAKTDGASGTPHHRSHHDTLSGGGGGRGRPSSEDVVEVISCDVEYTDEVALVAGRESVHAEYNVTDRIPELRSRWRLWLKGLQVDLTMPDAGSGKAGERGAASETIRATWREPSDADRAAGALGSLALSASITPHVHARIAQGRFWSDNALLHVGSFRGVLLESAQGSVDAKAVISFEADGIYLTIEELKLGMRDISVTAENPSSRIGLLLSTWSLQRWMLDSWVEQLILRLVEEVVVKEQQHQRIVRWDDVPLLRGWAEQMALWQQKESAREEGERRTAALAIQSIVRGRAVRRMLPPPVVHSEAKSLAAAVAELFPDAATPAARSHARRSHRASSSSSAAAAARASTMEDAVAASPSAATAGSPGAASVGGSPSAASVVGSPSAASVVGSPSAASVGDSPGVASVGEEPASAVPPPPSLPPSLPPLPPPPPPRAARSLALTSPASSTSSISGLTPPVLIPSPGLSDADAAEPHHASPAAASSPKGAAMTPPPAQLATFSVSEAATATGEGTTGWLHALQDASMDVLGKVFPLRKAEKEEDVVVVK